MNPLPAVSAPSIPQPGHAAVARRLPPVPASAMRYPLSYALNA